MRGPLPPRVPPVQPTRPGLKPAPPAWSHQGTHAGPGRDGGVGGVSGAMLGSGREPQEPPRQPPNLTNKKTDPEKEMTSHQAPTTLWKSWGQKPDNHQLNPLPVFPPSRAEGPLLASRTGLPFLVGPPHSRHTARALSWATEKRRNKTSSQKATTTLSTLIATQIFLLT